MTSTERLTQPCTVPTPPWWSKPPGAALPCPPHTGPHRACHPWDALCEPAHHYHYDTPLCRAGTPNPCGSSAPPPPHTP
jgi:hypothetical protein